MSTGRNVVWVLGAGFSRPLGGPLLYDFFRPELHEKLKARYSTSVHWTAFHEGLCRLSRAYFGINVPAVQPSDNTPRGTPWRNPEEFIEYMELAAQGDAAAAAVLQASYARASMSSYPFDIPAHARAAKKYLALCCWEFLDGADCKTERWAPYRAWAERLDPNADAVITFNYDTVCEQVLQHMGEQVPSYGLRAPWCVPREGEEHAEGSDRHLKLHGSCSWYVAPEQAANALCFSMATGDTPSKMLLESPHAVPAIAVPGPDKVGLAGRLFKRHWERAEEPLKTANTIVFVGYRFPESDNEAKRRLLGAIAQNRSHELSVHIVLGPKRDDDVIRLEGLLDWCLLKRTKLSPSQAQKLAGGRGLLEQAHHISGHVPGMDEELKSWYGKTLACVVHQPLWSQDFLGVFQRHNLDLFAIR